MNIAKKHHGLIVPLVTPMTADLQLDKEAVSRILLNLRQFNASPFILGTTGESPLLSHQVKIEYLETIIKLKPNNVKLYVGAPANAIKETIEFSKQCFGLGADAVVVSLPFYYKLSENQMRKYFLNLADQLDGDMIVYNIPATTHMSIPLTLIDELSFHENIVATKDSERSDTRLDASLKLWSNRKDFSHLLGWAAKSAYALLHGSDGLVPSTGNLVPSIYDEMVQALRLGLHEKAYYYQQLSDLLGNIYQAGRSLGESIWALKVLMQQVGLCQSYMTPPLLGMSVEEEERLKFSFNELVKEENIKLSIYNHV
ncbi:dihydrodipicolinate synthase family protein [Olivibacter sp. SDN3]|uniref:dihydrodipicolinate synthase family protein n=1 Tax=Olivibacter sp. SDN3 TaxID=2764720 RepID=UPI0016513B71|nr:dihydrodipicolinate synthase family protein [Olivibacter sp. SDN3]QNL48393.1 dihydrodipicolinate synthase family protein [Olivibacter sp. SDN3]